MYKDPFTQFKKWYKQAVQYEPLEPNATILATATLEGKPSTRTVLMKGFDKEGLVFHTHYESRKSCELKANPHASLTFLWKQLQRQVTIEGIAHPLPKKESTRYFATRPRDAQISCWASRQGETLASKDVLLRAREEVKQKYKGQSIPLPAFWGGWRVTPFRFEFWQGGKSRLHDRFQYLLVEGVWQLSRLSP